MATGLFTLKQVNQAVRQNAWSNTSTTPVYAASFNGSSQYLNVSTATIAATGQFCIEAWVFQTSRSISSSQGIFSQYSAGVSGRFYFRFNSDKLSFSTSAGDNISTSSVYVNTWYHVAVTRDASNVLRLFINGVLDYNASVTQSLQVTTPQIGGIANGELWNGYISNLRTVSGAIPTSYQTSSTTNGTVVFTPSTTNLTTTSQGASGTSLLTLQNATIIDNSSNAYTITNNGTVTMGLNYSVFNPSIKTSAVNYLVVAGGGSGGLGGGGAGGLLQGLYPVTTGSSITVTVGAGGSSANGSNSVFGNITTTGGGLSGGNPGNGGSGGSGGGTYFGTSNMPGQGVLGQGNAGAIGPSSGGGGGGGGGAGSAGIASYQINYGGNGGQGVASAISGTVTAYAGGGGAYGSSGGGPGGSGGGGNGPTAGGNGSAGTANTGGGGGGSTGGGALSGGSGIVIVSYPDVYAAPTATTGSPTVSTSGSGSLLFGGSTQYLSYSANSFNTAGNWTIEAWVYLTSSSNSDYIVCGLASDRLYIQWAGTNFYVGDAITNTIAVTGNKPLNQWLHVAVVKNGSTYTAYFNGTSIGSSTTALTATTLTTWQVGGRSSNSSYTQGYISNLRIVTSAVYTANFTVPTAPLTPITNTQLLLNSVSGAYVTDSSANANAPTMTNSVTWNQLSPFSVPGYKNRVYTWTSSGSITF